MLPVLMLIILGILYFGRYESYSTQMTQLAEQGARDAAVDFQVPSGVTWNGQACSTSTSQNLACFIGSQATGELASGSSDASKISVTVSCNGSPNCSTTANSSGSTDVTVCTQATVQFPFLPIKTGTIYQSATMRVEQSGTGNAGSLYVTDVNAGSTPYPNC